MGNKPVTEMVSGEPEICMPGSHYETLMKNNKTLEKVIHANKIINDATYDLDDIHTPFPIDHYHTHRHHTHRDHIHRHHHDNAIERYHYPQVIPNDLLLKDTGLPNTSEVTKSFERAKYIRSPYDRHWLNIYNNHAQKTNYNL